MEIPQFVFELSRFAEKNGQFVYLVGGAVRDFIMNENTYDLDFLCSQNAIELARQLEREGFATVQSLHENFGTAKIILKKENLVLDLATARSETYERPGALPKVQYPTSINEDLIRRDFTINAIALQIFSNKKTEFIDPFNGKSDIQNKVIQVLHSKSYWEDPTRIIRAARFATRFGFKVKNEDEIQIKEAFQDEQLHGLISEIRGARVGIELKRLLQLDKWLEGASLLHELDGWKLLSSDVNVNLNKPLCSLINWESRLLWLLWNNEGLLNWLQIMQVSGAVQKAYKQICRYVETKSEPSLKLFNDLNSLEPDFRNLLFSLHSSYWKLYQEMSHSLPEITPQELLQQGLHGEEIKKALEGAFQQRYKSLMGD